MPGPTTEAVNDDLKELRGELHRVEVNLAADVGRVSIAVSRLQGEFAAFKWLLGATFGVAVGGVMATAWAAGSTSAKLEATSARLDRLEASIGRLIERGVPAASPTPLEPRPGGSPAAKAATSSRPNPRLRLDLDPILPGETGHLPFQKMARCVLASRKN